MVSVFQYGVNVTNRIINYISRFQRNNNKAYKTSMTRNRPRLFILLCFTNFIFNIATSDTVQEECPGMNRECVLNYYGDLSLARRYPVKVN